LPILWIGCPLLVTGLACTVALRFRPVNVRHDMTIVSASLPVIKPDLGRFEIAHSSDQFHPVLLLGVIGD
jgi:hypothetical protein